MKIYCVGGAVRDELLGLPVQDRDWVVVGAAPEDMERLGYKAVGKDFPVFLHPQSHEEYALARTERKVARGYKGFTVYAAADVTLEQDLQRRDLTINAMARDESGALIDPHGGARDLQAKLLRHVGEAFIEDPVRILRVARFAARFDFAVAAETLELMRRMVADGETDALVAERVWQEFSKGLMEAHAQRQFEVLAACGLLAKLLPELALSFDAQGRPADAATRQFFGALGRCASAGQPLEVRFALLAFALRPGNQEDHKENAARAVAERLRASNECRDALVLAAARGEVARRLDRNAGADAVLTLLEAADAFRRPERLRLLLAACQAMDAGEGGAADRSYPPADITRTALQAASAVDAAAIAAANKGKDIGAAVRAARLAAVSKALT